MSQFTTYDDILNELVSNEAKFIIVGSFSKYLYNNNIQYKDIDIIYENSIENINKLQNIFSLTENDVLLLSRKEHTRLCVFINDTQSIDILNDLHNFTYYDLLPNTIVINYNSKLLNIPNKLILDLLNR